MVFTFQKPISGKKGDDMAYVFRIETDNSLTAETEEPLKACAQNPLYLNELLTVFLSTCSVYFKNKTTVAAILKVLKHEVQPTDKAVLSTTSSNEVIEPATSYLLTPLDVSICKGLFYIHWNVTGNILQLDFPVEVDTGLQPTDTDSIPFADTNEVIEVLPATPMPSRSQLDRTKVKEAQLRAKLAAYKANRAHLEYIEKYGQEPSDSSDEEESDDESSESDSY